MYDGFFKVSKYSLRHKLFRGGWSEIFEREIFNRGHAVAMLPYDPVLDEFVFIEQFRVGAIETAEQPWLMEIVAGMIEEGEDVESVCRRESQEEAGLEVKKLIEITDYLPSPGGMTERIYLYLGIVDAKDADGIYGLDHENEDIKVHRISRQNAIEMLKQGVFDNSAIIIAMQWFLINQKEIIENS